LNAELLFTHPFVPVFFMLMLIGAIFVIIGFIVGAEIIVSPIKGFVIGALVHDETYIENNKQITEYTLQCLLGIISINVIWETHNGSNELPNDTTNGLT